VTVTTMTPHRGVVRSTMAKGWAQHGICGKAEPDPLFARGAAQQAAKQICKKCPVILECLADSLDNHTEFGVWGGMTERERRALLKRRPEVASWRKLFEANPMRRGATPHEETASELATCRCEATWLHPTRTLGQTRLLVMRLGPDAQVKQHLAHHPDVAELEHGRGCDGW
jgi:WhiB family redox-sensing transcriptional regulator